MNPRILIYDIENMAMRGWAWPPMYETNILKIDHRQHFLSFAWKWHGDKKIHALSLPDFKGYKKDPHNDLELIKELWKLYDEADIVLAHNGDSFDQKMATTRFVVHRLGPPKPYQQMDTLKAFRKYARFTSNKLDDLSEELGHGKKIKTDFDLWLGCDEGNPLSWAKMVRYNKRDVQLLESIYEDIRPFMTNHPNLATISGRPDICPVCGRNEGMLAQGWRITKTARYRRWQCKSCGSYVSNLKSEKAEKPQYV